MKRFFVTDRSDPYLLVWCVLDRSNPDKNHVGAFEFVDCSSTRAEARAIAKRLNDAEAARYCGNRVI